jgi:A/G-specific adenine glycosylase
MGAMPIDPQLVSSLHQRLLAHFDAGHRDLPWRGDRSPYRVWVSEIMLQQTRVEAVIPYFTAWMERYPDVATLAEASESEVLKSWEGLGYYSRARNLHRAAGLVRETMAGRLPDTVGELRTLPGIGEYTSGAIASLAFGARVPAVDGNVRRVLSRVFDLEEPTPSVLTTLAAELVPPDRPGDWNEALMEFGATACLPMTPHCEDCPLGDVCGARAAGTVSLRPPPRRKARVRDVSFEVVVPVRCDGALFMVRRPSSGLLGGLWEFPQRELHAVPETGDREAFTPALNLGLWGVEVGPVVEVLPVVPHAFTHIRARYWPTVVSASGGQETEDARWFQPEDAAELALPVAQRIILTGVPFSTA